MPANQVTITVKLDMIGLQGLSQLTTALNAMKTAVGGAGTGINAAGPALAKVSAQNRGIAAIANSFMMADRNAKGFVTRLSEVERRFDPIFRAGFRMQMVGNDLFNLGKMGVRALTDLMGQFGNFEFMVNRAAGAMGILKDSTLSAGDGTGAVVSAYDALTSKIMSAATEAKLFPAQEVAQAMYYWASATGLQVKELSNLDTSLTGVTSMMQAAALTQSDIQTVIKGTYSVLIQYGLGLDQTTRVTQELFLITQRTAAEFPDLINSFKMVGPVAHSIGVSFESVAITLGKLADAGIRGTMAGRALRQFFIQTVRPSAQAEKAVVNLFGGTKSYLELIENADGSFIGFDAWIGKLAERTKNLGLVERAHILAQITTANELPVVTAMVQAQIATIKHLPGAWDESKYSMVGASKAFRDQWGLLANSWNGVVATLQRAFDNIKLIVGRTLSETFTPLVKTITTSLSDLGDWVASHQEIVALAGKFVAIGSAALLATGIFFKFVGGLLAIGSSVVVTVAALGPLIARFTFFGGLITGIVQGVIKQWDYLVKSFQTAQKNISDALNESGNAMGNVKGFLDSWVDTFQELGSGIVKSFADGIVWVSKGLAAILANRDAVNILSGLVKLIAAFLAIKYITGMGMMVGSFLGLGKAISALRFTGAILGIGTFQRLLVTTNKLTGETISTVQTLGKGASMSGLRGGLSMIKSMLGGPLGVVGLVLGLGLAFIAVAPDAMKFVDSVTDRFRDMKKELTDLKEQFGQFGAVVDYQAHKVAASTSSIADAIASITQKTQQAGGRGSGSVLVSGFDYVIDGVHKFAYSYADALAGIQGQSDRIQATIEKGWVDDVNAINDQLAKLGRGGEGQVGLEQLAAQADAFSQRLGIGWSDAEKLAVNYFENVNHSVQGAANSESLKAYYDKLVAPFTSSGRAAPFTLQQFLFGAKFDPSAAASQAQVDARVLYDSYFENVYADIQRLADSGTRAGSAQAMDKLLPFLKGGAMSNISSEEATKAGALYSQIVGQGFVDGYDENGDKILSEVEKIRSDNVKRLTAEVDKTAKDYAGTLGGFREKVMAALKAPGDVKTASRAIEQLFNPKGFIAKGVTSDSSQARKIAELWIDNNLVTFQDVINDALPGQEKQLYDKIQKLIDGGIPKNLTEGQLTDLAGVIDQLYSKLGKKEPDWVTKRLKDTGAGAINSVVDGANKAAEDVTFSTDWFKKFLGVDNQSTTVPLPKIPTTEDINATMQPYINDVSNNGTAAMSGFTVNFTSGIPAFFGSLDTLMSTTKSKLSNSSGAFAGGLGIGGSWADGLERGFDRGIELAENAARRVADIIGNSPPKVGPLVHAESGGYSVAMMWGEGYRKATPKALKHVKSYADAVANINHSIEGTSFGATTKISSDRKSHHTVEVKVTSPDGSVDRVKASELERSISVSGIWDEIEHLVSIG